MIEKILQELTADITALGIFERFAPLVYPATRDTIKVMDDGTPVKIGEEVAPVAHGITGADCWENGKYRTMYPDFNKKSIAYFQQLGPLRMGNYIEGDEVFRMSATVRFFAWFNIPKLNLNGNGQTDVNISDMVALKLVKTLNGKKYELVDAQFDKVGVKLLVEEIEAKTPALFQPFTFDNLGNWMLYPYDYLGIRFRVEAYVNLNCIQDFTIDTPIECITTY